MILHVFHMHVFILTFMILAFFKGFCYEIQIGAITSSFEKNIIKCDQMRKVKLVPCNVEGMAQPIHSRMNRCIVNTLRPRQDGGHFPDDIFKRIFLYENV